MNNTKFCEFCHVPRNHFFCVETFNTIKIAISNGKVLVLVLSQVCVLKYASNSSFCGNRLPSCCTVT